MQLLYVRLRDKFNRLHDQVSQLLWQQHLRELPGWQRVFIRAGQIVVAIGRDLSQGQLSLRAMSLVFTTLVGFFPMVALIFSVFKSFGVHNALEPTLLALLEPLGDTSGNITRQILSYVDNLQVQLLGLSSVGLLIYLVLDMMRKIELSFNYIWDVKTGRSWSSRISEYMFAVIVCPLLVFMSLSITTYVNTHFFEAFLENMIYGTVLIKFFANLVPIVLMSLGFAFAYSFLPNTRVQFFSALIGGFTTTIIWKLMGALFQGFFVTTEREAIYLAFASAIVIMFFIYICWLVALIGSSIAFYHQNPAKTRTGRDWLQLSINQQEALTLAVAAAIIDSFNKAEKPMNQEDLVETVSSNPMAVEHAIENLIDINLITPTHDNPPRYVPIHAVNNCSIVEIWRALRNINADALSTAGNAREMAIIRDFQTKLNDTIERELGDIKFTDALNGKG